ncbi:hypothetical protein INT43_002544 [Umbelopsis isabellina]|uniref:Uncharacterized protein n=1 Tax=Mortierella isabellina TaxID=91625 RepID=A0A8H7Q7D7_MORIS|nr:hypothetical protein INT43_002544 [Umbelopsis isabellina]
MSKLSDIHLAKADSLCHDWLTAQNSTIALLSSIANILQQRSATVQSSSSLIPEDTKSALLYKQTVMIEESLANFKSTCARFRTIVKQMAALENEAAKNATYNLQEPEISNRPNTSAALIAVATISEYQVSIFISQIYSMYDQECKYKTTLSNQLYQQPRLDVNTVNDLLSLWSSQSKLDFSVERDMAERYALYKKVKKVVEAKD